jgi:hypothetical protein
MTDKEKEHKKARDALDRFSKAILMQYSFHKIKTFNDLLKAVGFSDSDINQRYFPSERNRTLSFSDVKDYLSDRRIELTTAQWLELNPPQLNYEIKETNIASNVETTRIHKMGLVENRIEPQRTEEIFERSPNEKAFFFWFQKKAITQLMKGILGE